MASKTNTHEKCTPMQHGCMITQSTLQRIRMKPIGMQARTKTRHCCMPQRSPTECKCMPIQRCKMLTSLLSWDFAARSCGSILGELSTKQKAQTHEQCDKRMPISFHPPLLRQPKTVAQFLAPCVHIICGSPAILLAIVRAPIFGVPTASESYDTFKWRWNTFLNTKLCTPNPSATIDHLQSCAWAWACDVLIGIPAQRYFGWQLAFALSNYCAMGAQY